MCPRSIQGFFIFLRTFDLKGFQIIIIRLELKKEGKRISFLNVSGDYLGHRYMEQNEAILDNFRLNLCFVVHSSFFIQRGKFQYILNSKFMRDFKLQSTQCPKRAHPSNIK